MEEGQVYSEDEYLLDTTGIDLTKGNTYDIQFQWRGVGNYNFFINQVLVKTVEYLGNETELSMFNPSNPVAFVLRPIDFPGYSFGNISRQNLWQTDQ